MNVATDAGPETIVSIGAADGGPTLPGGQDGRPVPGPSGPPPLVGEDPAAYDDQGLPLLTAFVRDDAGDLTPIRFSGRPKPRSRRSPPCRGATAPRIIWGPGVPESMTILSAPPPSSVG